MKILLLGSIGCGKSTQAQILADDLGFDYIRSGDLVREKAHEATTEGRECKECLENGHLVSDLIIAPLVQARLEERQSKGQHNFIFDGYIRRLSQLKVWDPEYDLVVFLKVPEATVRERLAKRERTDDKPEIIEERLKVYHQETEPVIQYYQKKGILWTIDASGTIEQVTKKIEEHFKEIKERYGR